MRCDRPYIGAAVQELAEMPYCTEDEPIRAEPKLLSELTNYLCLAIKMTHQNNITQNSLAHWCIYLNKNSALVFGVG